MVGSVTDISAGLVTRLESSLPLETKCRLTVNMFTSGIYFPQKESILIDWLLASLDVKYRDRLESSHSDDDLHLWAALKTCLECYKDTPPSIPYNFNTAPDILLNILPYADLSLTPIMSCISHLLSLSSSSCPAHPSWPSLLTEIISKSVSLPSIPGLLITSMHTALDTVSVDSSKDNTNLLLQLSNLHTLHPHPSLQSLVSKLLFTDTQPYQSLFTHLAGGESKYHPTQGTSLLLTTMAKLSSPLLIMSSCPSTPPWLKPCIFSLLLSTQGCTGLVDKSTVAGAKLITHKTPIVDNIPVLFRHALPLDLAVEVRSGVTVSKTIQEVIKELAILYGITEELADVVAIVHEHHPQVLEPLLSLILGKSLSSPNPVTVPVFPLVLDVMVKLRQVPKLFSKLFLYMRTPDCDPKQGWSKCDLDLLGSTLSSLPRVQFLEMWKSLNYHVSTDILASTSQEKANQFSSVLSPILSTVLLNSQLADHNLPSTLVPRIQDLMNTTADNLQAVISKDILSGEMKTLLLEVGSALAELSKLFHYYRDMKESDNLLKFNSALVKRVLEENWAESDSKKRLLVPWFLDNENMSIKKPEYVVSALLRSSCMKQIPDSALIDTVELITTFPASILEQPVLCGVVIYSLLSKINKEENLFIPQFSYWRCEEADKLDSYLGKSLRSCLTTVFHSEICPPRLAEKDLDALGVLPLEYLPPALKLGATLVSLTQVFRKADKDTLDKEFGLLGRCLESTDIFRFIDAGKFLNDMMGLNNVPEEVIKVVTKSISRFTKPIKDVELTFKFEETVPEKNNMHLKVCVSLLDSLSKSVCEGLEGTDKKEASQALTDKISKHIIRIFKKRDLDNSEQINILCDAASVITKMYSKTGLGKMSKMVYKMAELSLSESCKGMPRLLGEICTNLDYLDRDLLPKDWKLKGWEAIITCSDKNYGDLAAALLKTSSPSELGELLANALETQALNLDIWKIIVSCEVSEDCMKVKNDCIERCVAEVCKAVQGEDSKELEGLADFLSSLFSCSPPCLSTQSEILCLGTLLVIPQHSAPDAFSALATFLSHRSSMSTRTISITTLIIRNFLSSTANTSTLHALQKVLGLFSRHKTDYSSILPYLVADLVTTLSAMAPANRGLLTTSIFPLLDMLDTHSYQYLSNNLAPATNEIFKHLLTSYNSSHKFKGKV